MEKHCHVIFVIGRIETSDVDKRISLTVSEILSVQRRPSVIREIDRLPIVVCVLDILSVRAAGCEGPVAN